MSLAYTMTPRSVNILLDGRMRTIDESHINYGAVRERLQKYSQANDAAIKATYVVDLRDLLDIPSFLAKVTEGRVQVGDNQVLFDGQKVHGVIATRILAMLQGGFDVRPMARFLDRLMNNPLESARDELYLWLEAGKMPITEDGCFLAFKKVRGDYRSIATGYKDGKTVEVWNRIGDIVEMPREDVDPDRHNTCSRGLHFCSYDYLEHYGNGGEERIVIVKIDPADVVAIPTDYSNTKGRTWRYEVVGEVPEDEAQKFFTKPVVSSFDTYQPPRLDDDSWEDWTDGEEEEDNSDVDDDSWEDWTDGEEEEDNSDVDEEFSDYPDEEDPIVEEDPPAPIVPRVSAPPQEKPKRLAFDANGKRITAAQLLKQVGKLGQRGFARAYGVSRTTVQGWLKKAQKG